MGSGGNVALPDSGSEIDAGGDGASDTAVGTIDGGASVDGAPVRHPSDFVFDDRKLSTWRIVLTDADLKKLDATAVMETFVPATLQVDGEDVGRVGVRYKGAYASFRACFVNGVNTCKKLSYKIDFAEYDPPKRFHSLKKINLHSQTLDGTHLHERLAYQVYRQHHIPAPRSVHAKVYVNGQYKGLFGLTENIDGRFTSYAWPGAGDGNLYKEAWPLSADPKYYVSHQKTNEPDPGDPTKRVVAPTKILAFQKEFVAASPAERPKVLDSWMNLDYMFRVLAVDHAVGNWDGPLTFYCSGGSTQPCTNHNYNFYEAERENRLWLVPWDLDAAFQFSLAAERAIQTPWDQPPVDCLQRFQAFPTVAVVHPGCDRIYRALALAGRDRFVTAINDLLAGPFNPARMRRDLDVWTAQIADAVRTDAASLPFADWQKLVAALRARLDPLRDKLIAIRDRKPWTPPP